ncbi:MAG: hypothetical protein HQK54_15730 [Oligoflexales bacterium]|nr:hypothetical protein [Oligoflexales bacterium]
MDSKISIKPVLLLSFVTSHFQPPLLYAQAPSLNVETIQDSRILSKAPQIDQKSHSQKTIAGTIFVPLINNKDIMAGAGTTFAETGIELKDGDESFDLFKNRNSAAFHIFAVQKGDDRAINGFFIISQQRDIHFRFPYPKNELTLGGNIKTGLFDCLSRKAKWDRLTLGLVTRRFPDRFRFIPYFSQSFSLDRHEVKIEVPGEIYYSYFTVPKVEKVVLSFVIDDITLSPYSSEQSKGWLEDLTRYRAAFGYQRIVLEPAVFFVNLGTIAEYGTYYDINGERILSYFTRPAPYLQTGITAWL